MVGSEPPGVPTAAPRYPPFQGITPIRRGRRGRRGRTSHPLALVKLRLVVPQFGIAKLVNTTPITMVYGIYIYLP